MAIFRGPHFSTVAPWRLVRPLAPFSDAGTDFKTKVIMRWCCLSNRSLNHAAMVGALLCGSSTGLGSPISAGMPLLLKIARRARSECCYQHLDRTTRPLVQPLVVGRRPYCQRWIGHKHAGQIGIVVYLSRRSLLRSISSSEASFVGLAARAFRKRLQNSRLWR
jgi:hypothetical protein